MSYHKFTNLGEKLNSDCTRKIMKDIDDKIQQTVHATVTSNYYEAKRPKPVGSVVIAEIQWLYMLLSAS